MIKKKSKFSFFNKLENSHLKDCYLQISCVKLLRHNGRWSLFLVSNRDKVRVHYWLLHLKNKPRYLINLKEKIMFKNKKHIVIAMVAIIALVGLIYAGCSKSADMQTTPGTNQVMSTMDVQSTAVDCENWTWEELNEWAEPIAKTLDCKAFNEMVRTDKCFKIWFNEWCEREKEAGNATLIERKEFHADEHTTGPNCGVVDEGNDNCFNGDFEKLDAWVQKIIDRGNEKEVMNKMNHNPCARKWMREMGLLTEATANGYVEDWKYTSINYPKCPLAGCDGSCEVINYQYTFLDDDGFSYYESGRQVNCNQ